MYLHEDEDIFKEVIESASEIFHVDVAIVEKDYYVSMILKLLSQKLEHVVFKGGTSLSKGFHVLSRFSEDIDITFDEHIGEGKRKTLKYKVMKSISEELGMPIENWNKIESDKNYNYYLFKYNQIDEEVENNLLAGTVKIETALASYAFPTVNKEIDSYIRRFLEKDNKNLISEYNLEKFTMKLQTIERTYIDKVFALCDYYINGKSKRYSRHLYDIYKLTPLILFDDSFKELVKEVRWHRATMKICPSALPEVNIVNVVHEFCNTNFYKSDYEDITEYFVNDTVNYEDAINTILKLVDGGWFS